MSSMKTENWMRILVPLAVEVIREIVIPLIFGKKTTKNRVVAKLQKGGFALLKGLGEPESCGDYISLVEVDEKIIPLNRAMKAMSDVAKNTNTRFIVTAKGAINNIPLSDKKLKEFGLMRIDNGSKKDATA